MENSQAKLQDGYIAPFFKQRHDQVEQGMVDDSIEALLPRLGLYDTPELNNARATVLIALQADGSNPSWRKIAWNEYTATCEQIINNLEISTSTTETRIEALAKIQIALIIHKALIFREAGKIPSYIKQLDYAEAYADNEGFSGEALMLQLELDTTIKTSELSPESLLAQLPGELSEMNRAVLRDRVDKGANLEDTINYTCIMLHAEQWNPDEESVNRLDPRIWEIIKQRVKEMYSLHKY